MTIVLNGGSGITTPSTTSDNIVADNIVINAVNGGPLAGFRNAIINGNFDIWQRGTSFSLFQYGADRWVNGNFGTASTQSRQDFALGQTAVPGEPTHFCRTVVSSVAGVNNNSFLLQYIEDVRTFAGQTVTLSFWAKADSTKNIAVEFSQSFGTGGSPSADLLSIGVTKVSVSTTWQKVTVTATIPSISGKILGTNNNHSLRIIIFFDAGSNLNSRTDSLGHQSGTFDIAEVQLEAGSVATPFERRPIGTELALCQRYYTKSYSVGVNPASVTTAGVVQWWAANANSFHQINVPFPVAMRADPVIVTYSSTNGASGVIRNSSSGANVAAVGQAIGNRSFTMVVNNVAITNAYLEGHFTADAEL